MNQIKKVREGTKKNPTKIYTVYDFFVYCPKCEDIVDCGIDDKKVVCPNCKRAFHVDFNSMDCGL